MDFWKRSERTKLPRIWLEDIWTQMQGATLPRLKVTLQNSISDTLYIFRNICNSHLLIADGVISSKFSMVHSSKNSKIGLGWEPTEIYAIKAKFFTSPTAWPSGVSAGQIIPQWVLWSCRGRASLPSRPMGEFRRRKWDNVEAKVSLLSTWDTPARDWWAFFWSPQFPVAREYLRPSVITLGFRASSMLKSCKMKCH